ncbi:hypothetical protein K523DRAFT_422383, partial [Schizophyllum commune Tattone D]
CRQCTVRRRRTRRLSVSSRSSIRKAEVVDYEAHRRLAGRRQGDGIDEGRDS